MDRRPTNYEWTELLQPYLAQFYKQSARKKLCQLHRGAVKESKAICPWPDGEVCVATINARELKILIIFPDGSNACLEYDANGNLTQETYKSPDGTCLPQD